MSLLSGLVSREARHWSTSTPHFLVEYVMAVHMILGLLKLVQNSIKWKIIKIVRQEIIISINLIV